MRVQIKSWIMSLGSNSETNRSPVPDIFTPAPIAAATGQI